MEFIYLIIGFVVALIVIKMQLKSEGAGKCKMCKSCSYYLECKKQEREATNERK
jgi:hypothetical protein